MKKTLVLAGAKPKRASFEVRGTELVQTTWSAKGVAKVATKQFASDYDVKRAFDLAVRKKLTSDYVVISPPQPGRIMFEAFARGGGGGAVLDLSPDGTRLVTATMSKAGNSNFGVKLELVDIATGARRVIVDQPADDTQQFLHNALFDHTGDGVYYSLRQGLEYVDIASGARETIATHNRLNPHVVTASFDAARKRLVVIDGATVSVIDEARRRLCSVETKQSECRGTAISPSGRYLAIYLAPSLVHLYDVESGTLWETMTMPEPVSELGFSPNETELVVTFDYAKGPVGLRIPSAEQTFALRDDDRGELEITRGWSFSSDGRLLACAARGVRVLAYATKAAIELEQPIEFGRTNLVAFSRDGSRLAVHHGGTAYVYALG